jgi:MFS family permease
MVWYTQIPVHGHYAADLLPGYLLVGVGIAFSYVPVSIAALAGVKADEAGLASGLINTSQQIGGAIGVALASTVFTSHFDHKLLTPKLLTDGYALAFWVMAAFGVAAFLATLFFIRREELVQVPGAATATAD